MQNRLQPPILWLHSPCRHSGRHFTITTKCAEASYSAERTAEPIVTAIVALRTWADAVEPFAHVGPPARINRKSIATTEESSPADPSCHIAIGIRGVGRLQFDRQVCMRKIPRMIRTTEHQTGTGLVPDNRIDSPWDIESKQTLNRERNRGLFRQDDRPGGRALKHPERHLKGDRWDR